MIDENPKIEPKEFKIKPKEVEIEQGEIKIYGIVSQFDFQDIAMDQQDQEHIVVDDKIQANKKKNKLRHFTSKFHSFSKFSVVHQKLVKSCE